MLARGVVGNDRDGALVRDSLAEGIGVVGGIGDHNFGGQAFAQTVGLGTVTVLPTGGGKARRGAETAHRQVDLGAHTARR